MAHEAAVKALCVKFQFAPNSGPTRLLSSNSLLNAHYPRIGLY